MRTEWMQSVGTLKVLPAGKISYGQIFTCIHAVAPMFISLSLPAASTCEPPHVLFTATVSFSRPVDRGLEKNHSEAPIKVVIQAAVWIFIPKHRAVM